MISGIGEIYCREAFTCRPWAFDLVAVCENLSLSILMAIFPGEPG